MNARLGGLSILLSLFFVSCEDKELIQKNEELRVKLSELEKKAELMQISAGEDPGDQSEAIVKVNEELTQALDKLKELDQQKEAIEASQRKVETEFRDYQNKYRIE